MLILKIQCDEYRRNFFELNMTEFSAIHLFYVSGNQCHRMLKPDPEWYGRTTI